MRVTRLGIPAALVAAAAGAAIAGVGRYCTRPQCQRGIPSYDYQYGSRSKTEKTLSYQALPLQQRNEKHEVVKDLKHFQWKQATVRIDHCSISAPSLRLGTNGSWVLNLQADQNPPSDDVAAPAATPEGRYTAHLKRNQFVVTLRCYGPPNSEPTSADAPLGKPLLCVLGPTAFWVQRGRTQDVCKQGLSPCVEKYFNMIDRVEIEFYYR